MAKCNARFIKRTSQLKSDIRACQCKNFSLKQASRHDGRGAVRTPRSLPLGSPPVSSEYANFLVQVVMPATSVKHNADIFQRAFRVREYLTRNRTSDIFMHLQHSEECRKLCSKKCFSILDSVQNRRQFLLKEAAHIRWENPTLNKQLKYAELALSFELYFCYLYSYYFYYFFM